jgi:hypothetical protein
MADEAFGRNLEPLAGNQSASLTAISGVGGITPGTRHRRGREPAETLVEHLCVTPAPSPSGEGASSPHIVWACEAIPPLRRSSGLLTSA